MINTTLNKIREHSPCGIKPNDYGCRTGWLKLLDHLGKTTSDDEPLPLLTVLESNGLDDCLWCLRSVPEYNQVWRMYAVWCARQVRHLMTDARSLAALDVAWAHANGLATDEELAAAGDASRAAAWAAWDAPRAAAWAARDAACAAWDAAGDAQKNMLIAVLQHPENAQALLGETT